MMSQLQRSKTDKNVGFENISQRRLTEAEIIQFLLDLNNEDIEAGKTMLFNVIKKGKLLNYLKEQCRHGNWCFHLRTIGINERKAQRLMSLVRWEEQLMIENMKSIKKSKTPLSVSRAIAFANTWSKRDKENSNNPKTLTNSVLSDLGDFFEPHQKQRKDTLMIKWEVKISEIPRILETLDTESERVLAPLKEILLQHCTKES